MSRATQNFKSQFATLFFATLFCVQLVSGGIAEANGNYVTVTLDGLHRIRGQTEQTIYENRTFVAFRGVPFAEAPVGHLRFKPPVPKHLPHSLDALTYGSVCPQLYGELMLGSEDCLYLNVFTPAIRPNRKLAVIVFITGGGYVIGGIDNDYYGPDFLVERDVVMVSMNYRINAFGFMSLGNDEYAGQMGFHDQQLALRWVQRHIHHFGGDARDVTVLGSSAGSASIHVHMLSASSKGLFHRAILMSGSAGNVWTVSSKVDHRQQMMDLANKHNSSVATFTDLVDWLHRAPPMVLLEQDYWNIHPEIDWMGNFDFAWAPVLANGSSGHAFLIQNDLRQVFTYETNVDVLIGYNSDEMVTSVGPYYDHPSLFDALHNNFKTFLPFKSWTECKNATAYAEVMNEIRLFYFGDANVSVDTFPQLNALLSDVQFNYGIDKSVQHHVAHSTGNTYFYRISANTTLNIFKRLTNVTHLLLTSHVDEICYIFKCMVYPNIYDDLLPESTERKVQTHLLDLWTNFAKFGHPTPQGIPLDFYPTTADNHYLVDISNDGVTKVTNPNKLANDFWDTIYEKYWAFFEVPC